MKNTEKEIDLIEKHHPGVSKEALEIIVNGLYYRYKYIMETYYGLNGRIKKSNYEIANFFEVPVPSIDRHIYFINEKLRRELNPNYEANSNSKSKTREIIGFDSKIKLEDVFFQHSDDELLSSLQQVPLKYSRVLKMKFESGLTDKQIAQELQIKETDVRSKVDYGLKILKKIIYEFYPRGNHDNKLPIVKKLKPMSATDEKY